MFGRLTKPKYIFFLSVCVFILLLAFCAGYSWLFIGKFLAVCALPAFMAAFGNHLAAKNEPPDDQTFWRFIFTSFTVAIVIIGFVILDQDERNHHIELEKQRADAKADITSAIFQYNRDNPQQQIPLKLAARLFAMIDQGAQSRSSKSSYPPTPNNKQMNASILVGSATARLRDFCGEWQTSDTGYGEMEYDAGIQRFDSETERQKQIDFVKGLKTGADNEHHGELVQLIQEAIRLQSFLLSRIDKETKDDLTERETLSELWNAGLSRADSGWTCPADSVIEIANYLDRLAARVK